MNPFDETYFEVRLHVGGKDYVRRMNIEPEIRGNCFMPLPKDHDFPMALLNRADAAERLKERRFITEKVVPQLVEDVLSELRKNDPKNGYTAEENREFNMAPKFLEALKTAVQKDFVADLTEDEACAICLFCGVPWHFENGRMVFDRCGLYKRNGKWTAVMYSQP